MRIERRNGRNKVQQTKKKAVRRVYGNRDVGVQRSFIVERGRRDVIPVKIISRLRY